jgi:hypothetical protein
MTMRLQPRRDRLPGHRSQHPLRRSGSRSAHPPASCKSRSSRENPVVEVRCSSGHLTEIGGVAGSAHDLEAGAVEHAGQTFAQEDVVGREHYTGADCGHTDD